MFRRVIQKQHWRCFLPRRNVQKIASFSAGGLNNFHNKCIFFLFRLNKGIFYILTSVLLWPEINKTNEQNKHRDEIMHYRMQDVQVLRDVPHGRDMPVD